jgi:hypothetical protein
MLREAPSPPVGAGVTSRVHDEHPSFLEELVEDLIWVEGGPERLRGPGPD